MKFLKNLLNSFVLMFLCTCTLAVSAKFASLDIIKVYDNYSLVKEANSIINDAEAKVKRIIATADEELKALEKKGNEAELVKKRNEIQDIVDEEVEALQDYKDLYNTAINRNIQRTLDQVAKEKSYSTIFDRAYVMADTTEDISDEFLVKLEKNTTSLKTAKPAAK